MLKDETLWIIGANSDIAKSFVTKYASQFGSVVLACREPMKLSGLIAEYELKNIQVFRLDLTDTESVDDFLLNAPEPYGAVFFAGHIEYDGKNEKSTNENITATVAVNYLTPLVMIERIYDGMCKKGEGFISLISSAGEIRGKYSNRFYVSSKKAVSTYLEGLAQHSIRHNVKIMVFKLGHTDTKMLRKIEEARKPIFVASPEKTASFIFKEIVRNKSTVKYYHPVWKYIAIIYRLLPKTIYNKSEM